MDDTDTAFIILNYCREKFKPEDIWFNEPGCDSFRLAFQIIRGSGNALPRSPIYVDVLIDDLSVYLQDDRRRQLRINFQDPSSVDQMDEFIYRRSNPDPIK